MAAPDLIESLLPGSRLDRYELLCPLARGGMAAVWIARQTGKHGFEKLVALKTILPQYSRDTRFRRMFLDEAHIAAGIDHPNVAHILDLGEQHDLLYIVMEYVDGDALSRLQRNLGKKGLSVPPAIALRILADACAGLHAAHELRSREGQLLGVVHRDVSPQNVLVGVKGPSKVIDFGVAKARDRFEEQHTLHGKIQYMAPEQAMGKEIDRRADVWAIGAMLYALLAGAPPYEGENQIHSLQLLTSGKPPPPLPEWVPRPIVDVVRAVLVHEPHRRIPDAQMLQMAIEDAMVQSGLRASHSDVAQLMAEHLSDRADKRRSSIELALQAAAERERVAKLLPMPAPEGMTDMVNLNPRLMGAGGGAQGASAPGGSDGALGANTTSTLVPPLSFVPESRSRAWILGLAFAATVTSVGVASVLATRPNKPSSVVTTDESTQAAPVISAAGKVTPPPIPTELDLGEPTPSATAKASAAPTTVTAAPTMPTNTGAPPSKSTGGAPKVVAAPKPTATAAAPKPPVKPKAPDDGF